MGVLGAAEEKRIPDKMCGVSWITCLLDLDGDEPSYS